MLKYNLEEASTTLTKRPSIQYVAITGWVVASDLIIITDILSKINLVKHFDQAGVKAIPSSEW